MSGVPYERNIAELVRCNQGANVEEDLSSVFCSELTAAALIHMGVMTKEKVFFLLRFKMAVPRKNFFIIFFFIEILFFLKIVKQ